MSQLVLIANPGSASRKYALYAGSRLLASLHFEYVEQKVLYSYNFNDESKNDLDAGVSHIAFVATKVMDILRAIGAVDANQKLDVVGLRVVAPATHFQEHRILDAKEITRLTELETRAELHINATLQEAELLRAAFGGVPIIGASDSAFHATKPQHASTYAISQEDAKQADVWRFGYHGLSVSSVVSSLKSAKHLPARMVVCHLGSGASVTAVLEGKSIDTTMGYSPLEGLVMSTRSGSIDPTAVDVLADQLDLSPKKIQHYLNANSGLKGLSGASDDIRELLKLESSKHAGAKLALDSYVYHVQQAIGQMVAALGGIDGLVFTGTVGERSAEIRQRIVRKMLYLGIALNAKTNNDHELIVEPTVISQDRHPAVVMVVPTDEAASILQAVRSLTKDA